MYHVVRIPEIAVADQGIAFSAVAPERRIIRRAVAGIGVAQLCECVERSFAFGFGGVPAELAAAGEQVHPTAPEHPLKAVEGKMAHDPPLFGRQFPVCFLEDIGPVSDVGEKFAAVVAELNLRAMLVIAAVRPDAAETPGCFMFGGCEPDLFGKDGGGAIHHRQIAFKQGAAEDVCGDENAVVAGVTAQEARLPADVQRSPARGSVREKIRRKQQDLSEEFRHIHVVPPPVAVLRLLFRPPRDGFADGFPGDLRNGFCMIKQVVATGGYAINMP